MDTLNYTEFCAGCLGDFKVKELSEDNYCESCQYEFDAKQDHKTDGE